MVTTQSKTLNYKQGTFSFFKAFENQSITHNNNEFLKLGEINHINLSQLEIQEIAKQMLNLVKTINNNSFEYTINA